MDNSGPLSAKAYYRRLFYSMLGELRDGVAPYLIDQYQRGKLARELSTEYQALNLPAIADQSDELEFEDYEVVDFLKFIRNGWEKYFYEELDGINLHYICILINVLTKMDGQQVPEVSEIHFISLIAKKLLTNLGEGERAEGVTDIVNELYIYAMHEDDYIDWMVDQNIKGYVVQSGLYGLANIVEDAVSEAESVENLNYEPETVTDTPNETSPVSKPLAAGSVLVNPGIFEDTLHFRKGKISFALGYNKLRYVLDCEDEVRRFAETGYLPSHMDGEIEGNSVIHIPSTENYKVRFGRIKARILVASLKEIRDFVSRY